MAYASITVDTAGFEHTVYYRGRTTAKDCIVWLHGSGGDVTSASKMLDRITARRGVLDVAPLGLLWSDGKPGWMHPEFRPLPTDDPTWPVGANGDEDILFLGALPAELKTRFPALKRCFLAGYSGGSKMVFSVLLNGFGGVNPYAGYAGVKNTPHGTWAPHSSLVGVPFGWWWGTADTAAAAQGPPNLTSEQTLAALLAAYGATESGRTTETCCAMAIEVRKYGTAKLRTFYEQGGEHGWLSCSGCSIDQKLIEFWRDHAGFGT